MIISASRRTDIPALYSDWLLKRLEAGFVMFPNPRNAKRLGRVTLSPELVDCIVFWTKNPVPMLDKLQKIDAMGYFYYFLFTITPYDSVIEPGLPPKAALMDTFAELARRGKAVIWRYDPVIIDELHTVRWHIEQFERMCERLRPFMQRCVISFIDPYKSIKKYFRAMTAAEITEIAAGFSPIAARYGLSLVTCAEEIGLERYNIGHSACIDVDFTAGIIGRPVAAKRAVGQRSACRCAESIDIGAYDTCVNGCRYCYAVSGGVRAVRAHKSHDINAPMLIGYPSGGEIITDRTPAAQLSLCE